MTKYQQIIILLENLRFSPPIPIPSFLGYDEASIYEIDGNKEKGIWLRMADGTWEQLEETDNNYELVADAILERLENGNNTLQS